MLLKQQVYDHFIKKIQDKVFNLQQSLDDLKESGSNETKSTAGDKHETALAMLQIEQANIREQLKETILQKTILHNINIGISPGKIIIGSLIKTNNGYFFLSIGLGKTIINGNSVFAFSPQSPLGQKFLGLKVGDVAELFNKLYTIESIE